METKKEVMILDLKMLKYFTTQTMASVVRNILDSCTHPAQATNERWLFDVKALPRIVK